MLEITGIDLDGEMLGRPLGWRDNEHRRRPSASSAERGAPALGVGERAVARFVRRDGSTYEARIIRALGGAPDRVLGVFRRERDGGRHRADRPQAAQRVHGRQRRHRTTPSDGEIVLAEVLPARRASACRRRASIERIGDSSDPRAVSLIAIHATASRPTFPPRRSRMPRRRSRSTLGDAHRSARHPAGHHRRRRRARFRRRGLGRARSRSIAGGWHALVAIADVAWYVRPGDALDRAAHERGNSVYFPDRVVPMLPEALSNELCSLKPARRARLHGGRIMWIDAEGRSRSATASCAA